jgi:adenylate kinase family enzyme
MNRVCVVGCGGAGKSAFAQKLGEITGLPVYYLDTYFWKPGWVQRETEEWNSIQRELLIKDKWILDGNYDNTQDLRFARADTIIFLDKPRCRCLLNVLKRLIRYYGSTRPDLPEGCNENFDLSFYKWIWQFRKVQRKRLMERLEKLKGQKDISILKSNKEIIDYLSRLKN